MLATVDTIVTDWWDIAQKGGAGAALVLIPVVIYLWQAYRAEAKYSKERDNQTLTVLLTITKLVEGIAKTDDTAVAKAEHAVVTAELAVDKAEDAVDKAEGAVDRAEQAAHKAANKAEQAVSKAEQAVDRVLTAIKLLEGLIFNHYSAPSFNRLDSKSRLPE